VTSTESFDARMQRVEALVREAEALADPQAQALARELVHSVLELHGEALARALALAPDRAAAFAEDKVLSSVLLLHGLHPSSLEDRVQGALEKVRPYLQSHGGDVELLGVEEGRIRLRLEGSCNGCPGSAMTLRSSIEEAIDEAAPDRAGLEVVGVVAPPSPETPLVALRRGPVAVAESRA
jgi:Fe-S cluster biogenesis protein NfuA